MRLAIVRRHLRGAGGAERFIMETTRALSRADVEVTLLSEAMDEGVMPAADWIRLPSGRGGRARKYATFQTSVAAVLARRQFDVVQTHERTTGADIFRVGDGVHAAWIDRLKRHRAAWRGPFLTIDPYHRLLIRSERRMARDGATLFVANSPMVAREIDTWLRVPAARVRVIENGVDLERFVPADERTRAEARARFGYAAHDRVIAFVGSGFERKGAFELVTALGSRAMADVKLLIAGRDKRSPALMRSVGRLPNPGNVTLLGPVADVRQVLHASDVFVLPTLYDPMPNAALEAIACGLPVVTTTDAGLADHIAAHGAGAVCSRDPHDIAAATAGVFDRLDEARAAAIDLRKRFDVDDKTRQWIALYEEICNR